MNTDEAKYKNDDLISDIIGACSQLNLDDEYDRHTALIKLLTESANLTRQIDACTNEDQYYSLAERANALTFYIKEKCDVEYVHLIRNEDKGLERGYVEVSMKNGLKHSIGLWVKEKKEEEETSSCKRMTDSEMLESIKSVLACQVMKNPDYVNSEDYKDLYQVGQELASQLKATS